MQYALRQVKSRHLQQGSPMGSAEIQDGWLAGHGICVGLPHGLHREAHCHAVHASVAPCTSWAGKRVAVSSPTSDCCGSGSARSACCTSRSSLSVRLMADSFSESSSAGLGSCCPAANGLVITCKCKQAACSETASAELLEPLPNCSLSGDDLQAH